MNRNDLLAALGLVVLGALALRGVVAGEAVVTFLGGLLLQRPANPLDREG